MIRKRRKTKCIALDLDGTAARYEGWKGPEHIGEPIPEVIDRVKRALSLGIEVYIFTARVAPTHGGHRTDEARQHINDWCVKHIGKVLMVTAIKLPQFDEFWDDKGVSVAKNLGTGTTHVPDSLWNRLRSDESAGLRRRFPLLKIGSRVRPEDAEDLLVANIALGEGVTLAIDTGQSLLSDDQKEPK